MNNQHELKQTTTPLDLLRKFLILGLCPFFYGAATRLPFIYYVIHLDSHFGDQITERFGSKWFPIGCFVAAYQFCRVVTNVVSLFLPRFSHLTGSVVGLAGFALVLGTDKDNLATFVTGTVMIGFSETMSSMQQYCKAEYTTDLALLQNKLKMQYAAVMFGVSFGFLVGGVVYEAYYIDGVAIFGIIVLSIEVLGTTIYFTLAQKSKVKKEVVELKKVLPTLRADTYEVDLVRKLTDEFSEGDTHANSIAWLIAFTMGFEALTIGYNLSVGPIFLLTEFNQHVSIIGILFAAGASCGTISAVSATLTKPGKWFFNKYLPAPLNIYVSLLGIGCSVLLAATPVLEMHVVGLLLMMAFNDLAATWLIEVQGAVVTKSAYKIVGPFGQIIRRSINSITAITGPLLFGIMPRSPYFVAGGLTLTWTLLVVFFLEKRRAATRSLLKEKLTEARYKAVMEMKWERQELVHQMILDKGSTAGAKLARGLELYGDELAVVLGDAPGSNFTNATPVTPPNIVELDSVHIEENGADKEDISPSGLAPSITRVRRPSYSRLAAPPAVRPSARPRTRRPTHVVDLAYGRARIDASVPDASVPAQSLSVPSQRHNALPTEA